MKPAMAGLAVLAALCLASCTAARMPSTFLHTPSAAWTEWLDRESNYGSFSGFTVRDIVNRLSSPADVKVEPSPALDQKVAHFDMKGLSVREALWKASRQYGIRLAWATTREPATFLDVLETQSRHDGPLGVTTLTEVMPGDAEQYLDLKGQKRIYREEVHDGTLYYAVRENRCLPFANGSSAMIIVIERYRMPAPTPAP